LKLAGDGYRIFADVLVSDENRLSFRRNLLSLLWERRDTGISLHQWLQDLRRDLISGLIAEGRTLDDDGAVLDAFIERTGADGDVSDMTLGVFSGFGEGNDRINLSTMHSAKGREFAIVVLFGMDDGRIPRNGATPAEAREQRRLFFVGFTRPESELHIMYSAARPSPFVQEVRDRLGW
jgi:DNA helicase-2/ATP-dependent DNA helicase PcrA